MRLRFASLPLDQHPLTFQCLFFLPPLQIGIINNPFGTAGGTVPPVTSGPGGPGTLPGTPPVTGPGTTPPVTNPPGTGPGTQPVPVGPIAGPIDADPVASGSGSSNAGVIAGSIIGGVAGLVLIGALAALGVRGYQRYEENRERRRMEEIAAARSRGVSRLDLDEVAGVGGDLVAAQTAQTAGSSVGGGSRSAFSLHRPKLSIFASKHKTETVAPAAEGMGATAVAVAAEQAADGEETALLADGTTPDRRFVLGEEVSLPGRRTSTPNLSTDMVAGTNVEMDAASGIRSPTASAAALGVGAAAAVAGMGMTAAAIKSDEEAQEGKFIIRSSLFFCIFSSFSLYYLFLQVLVHSLPKSTHSLQKVRHCPISQKSRLLEWHRHRQPLLQLWKRPTSLWLASSLPRNLLFLLQHHRRLVSQLLEASRSNRSRLRTLTPLRSCNPVRLLPLLLPLPTH